MDPKVFSDLMAVSVELNFSQLDVAAPVLRLVLLAHFPLRFARRLSIAAADAW